MFEVVVLVVGVVGFVFDDQQTNTNVDNKHKTNYTNDQDNDQQTNTNVDVGVGLLVVVSNTKLPKPYQCTQVYHTNVLVYIDMVYLCTLI